MKLLFGFEATLVGHKEKNYAINYSAITDHLLFLK